MSQEITFLAFGSRGDTQPYVAVGEALKARGHRVRIATGRCYGSLVREAGLEHLPIDVDIAGALATSHGQQWLGAERNPLRLARRLRPLIAAHARQVVADMADACADTDAVVCSMFGMMFRPAIVPPAVPFCYGGLQPTYPTREFPTIQLPHRRSFGGWANKRSHGLVETLLWQAFRSALTHEIRAGRGGRALPRRAPTAQLRRAGHPKLYGFSPAVVPRPADWPDSVHITGYWFTEPRASWTPPPGLAAFLADGPPPVFVGFGSMVLRDHAESGRLVRHVLRRAGVRGVLVGDPGTEASDDEFHVIAGAPHEWLFPRMAAVVHHGGAGTTAAALRAGVPQVVTPFFLDQPYWGERLHALGVGTPPRSIHALTSHELVTAVRLAVTDSAMRDRAELLKSRIARERGALRAADLLEEWMERVRG
ncbi:glycosyltransferase [Streptomyces spectabilis]|uniref:Glycosyltransferase n=1 Tax=Streptomyces spectabilis TaxID=68270 RepID=A0A5P2X437_STRST|nr:glycosyltransferase [Streptomyces spectabilis]MBB5100980.1 UDP:flavonoid glycosyltransferase YjiC (YdhE family) [Streptomyces spectabilis]MCI3900193.1 glycosyltransferase [Streptomyces spectabilis]QEV57800.1 glycosyltransferase [Streptomyces spectabilis]